MPERTISITSGGVTTNKTIPDRDASASVRTLDVNGSNVTINRTAPVISSDKKGQSRPLLSKLVGGAECAFSLRDLNDKGGNKKVVRIRRTDNVEVDVYGNGSITNITSGEGTGTLSFVETAWQANGSFSFTSLADTSVGAFGMAQYSSVTRTISGSFNSGDSVSLGFNITYQQGEHLLSLKGGSGSDVSNTVTINGSGSRTDVMTFNTSVTNPVITISYINSGTSNLSFSSFTSSSPAGDTEATNLTGFLTENSTNYDAFVQTWYDQSGNGKDASQTDITKQPKVANNGAWLGSLDFDGSNDVLNLSSSATVNYKYNYGSSLSVSVTSPTSLSSISSDVRELVAYGSTFNSGNSNAVQANINNQYAS